MRTDVRAAASETSEPLSASRRADVGLFAFLAAYAFIGFVPFGRQQGWSTLDGSWDLVLHEAFARGLQFGREIVFTFGPLGFVFRGTYHPATFAPLLAFWSILAIAVSGGTWKVLERRLPEPGPRLAVCLLLVGMLAISRDALLFAAPCLLLVRWFWGRWRWTLDGGWLLCATSLCALVKFSMLLAASLVLVLVSVDELRRRRSLWTLTAAAAVFLAGWLLCGQSLSGLPAYLDLSLELTRGYGDAMSIDGPAGPVVLYVASSLCLVGLGAWRAWRRRAWWWALPLVGLTGLAFLIFKAAFVRHDDHQLIATIALPFLAAVVVFGARAEEPASSPPDVPRAAARRRWSYLEMAVVGAAALVTVLHARLAARVMVHSARGAALLAVDRAALAATRERALAGIRARYSFADVAGSVDLLPYQQEAVIAYGLAYSPRPIFQSYAAYTPRLAELNAAHFRGARAPARVILGEGTIDQRYPTLDDARSRLELLRWYEETEVRDSFLVLRRRTSPRVVRLVSRGRSALTFGASMPVPATGDSALWASVDVRRTLLGRVWSLLYKLPEVRATVRTARGDVRTFRLVPEMARDGFVLSPLAGSPAALMSLVDSAGGLAPGAARVDSITFETSARRAAPFFEPTVRVSLFTIGVSSPRD